MAKMWYNLNEWKVITMLPQALHKFFWEYDPRSLNQNTKYYQIIERILEFGDLEANRWMVRTYSSEQIAEVVRNSRQLSGRTVALWRNILEMSEEEVPCLKTSCQKNGIPFLNS